MIRICKSKKDRQHNGQMKMAKRTNNDLQNITHKTKAIHILPNDIKPTQIRFHANRLHTLIKMNKDIHNVNTKDNKGKNKITELRTIFQTEGQN